MVCAKFDIATFDNDTFCDYVRVTETDSMSTSDTKITKLKLVSTDNIHFSDTQYIKLKLTTIDSVTFSDNGIAKLAITVLDNLSFSDVATLTRLIILSQDSVDMTDADFIRQFDPVILNSRITNSLTLNSTLYG